MFSVINHTKALHRIGVEIKNKRGERKPRVVSEANASCCWTAPSYFVGPATSPSRNYFVSPATSLPHAGVVFLLPEREFYSRLRDVRRIKRAQDRPRRPRNEARVSPHQGTQQPRTEYGCCSCEGSFRRAFNAPRRRDVMSLRMASLFDPATPLLGLTHRRAPPCRRLNRNFSCPERYTDLYNEYQALFETQIEGEQADNWLPQATSTLCIKSSKRERCISLTPHITCPRQERPYQSRQQQK